MGGSTQVSSMSRPAGGASQQTYMTAGAPYAGMPTSATPLTAPMGGTKPMGQQTNGMVQNQAGEWGKYAPGGSWHPNINNRFGAAPQPQSMSGVSQRPYGFGPGVDNYSPRQTMGGSYFTGDGQQRAIGSGQPMGGQRELQSTGMGGNMQLQSLLSQLFGRGF